MLKRLRAQDGFGLLELVIAILVLSLALLALVGAFVSAGVSQMRSSRLTTAATLVNKQLELYRALRYSAIGLQTAAVASAGSDPVYSGDPAFSASQFAVACTLAPECDPRQTVTGPDRQSYRIDTYVVQSTPSGGRQLKRVTVVVRDGVAPGVPIARGATIFDAALG